MVPQVRITGTGNMAQYWTSRGNQKSYNVTGSISAFKLADFCLSTGTVHWHFKFAKLLRKLGPAMALHWAESQYFSGNHVGSRKARVRPSSGSLFGRS